MSPARPATALESQISRDAAMAIIKATMVAGQSPEFAVKIATHVLGIVMFHCIPPERDAEVLAQILEALPQNLRDTRLANAPAASRA